MDQLACHVRHNSPLEEEEDGLVPLELAIQGKQKDAVEYLLKQHVAVDRATTIQEAILSQDNEILDLIIEAGGDLGHGLMIAVRNKDKRLAKRLLKHDAEMRLALTESVHSKDLEMLRFLVSHGGDPNAKALHGESILHIAVFNRDSSTVEYLLEQGAAVNTENAFGETPLKIALDRNHGTLVYMLRKHGAK